MTYDLSRLSPRRQQCYELLVQGHWPKMIAHKMNISQRTVYFHISAIGSTLGMTRGQLKEFLHFARSHTKQEA